MSLFKNSSALVRFAIVVIAFLGAAKLMSSDRQIDRSHHRSLSGQTSELQKRFLRLPLTEKIADELSADCNCSAQYIGTRLDFEIGGQLPSDEEIETLLQQNVCGLVVLNRMRTDSNINGRERQVESISAIPYTTDRCRSPK